MKKQKQLKKLSKKQDYISYMNKQMNTIVTKKVSISYSDLIRQYFIDRKYKLSFSWVKWILEADSEFDYEATCKLYIKKITNNK